jgi:ribosomal protein S18 acetylase RimI-like enzyme
MPKPDIRPASSADLQLLGNTFGDRRFFDERFERQQDHRGVLFVAWLTGRPVGNVYLWLEEAEEEPIRTHLPGIALLTHLEVRPGWRNRGIGTAIIEKLERYLDRRDHDRVALAVRNDNLSAARLYSRLGYRDWGQGLVVCQTEIQLPDGWIRQEPEECFVMVKELNAVPRQRSIERIADAAVTP